MSYFEWVSRNLFTAALYLAVFYEHCQHDQNVFGKHEAHCRTVHCPQQCISWHDFTKLLFLLRMVRWLSVRLRIKMFSIMDCISTLVGDYLGIAQFWHESLRLVFLFALVDNPGIHSESPPGSEFRSQALNLEPLLKRLRIWLQILEPISRGSSVPNLPPVKC